MSQKGNEFCQKIRGEQKLNASVLLLLRTIIKNTYEHLKVAHSVPLQSHASPPSTLIFPA